LLKSLAKKVPHITPAIQKLHAQLVDKKISPQSFADAANSEITSILQKTASKFPTLIDPSSSTHTTANSHAKTTNHYLSKHAHEALLQRTIQLHRNALNTLRKDMSLIDADTLTYHQNKLKQAQNDLIKSQTKKKQGKLLANVACGYGGTGLIAGQNLRPVWNYLQKYKNNHGLKLAPTHLLMPKSGRVDFLPSTPSIGIPTDLPWDATSSTTNCPHTTREKRN